MSDHPIPTPKSTSTDDVTRVFIREPEFHQERPSKQLLRMRALDLAVAVEKESFRFRDADNTTAETVTDRVLSIAEKFHTYMTQDGE